MVRNDAHYKCPWCDKYYAGNLAWKNMGIHVKRNHPLKWMDFQTIDREDFKIFREQVIYKTINLRL